MKLFDDEVCRFPVDQEHDRHFNKLGMAVAEKRLEERDADDATEEADGEDEDEVGEGGFEENVYW